jgi:hypothetical protein
MAGCPRLTALSMLDWMDVGVPRRRLGRVGVEFFGSLWVRGCRNTAESR